MFDVGATRSTTAADDKQNYSCSSPSDAFFLLKANTKTDPKFFPQH
jgi:hypothetical protein